MTDPNERTRPFWETTPLAAMTSEQWESLCDGCGKCCLEKYEDEESGDIVYSRVACLLLDVTSCRCTSYRNRRQQVPECVQITPLVLTTPTWLPETCAYRRLAEGRPLPEWHPLITGDPASTIDAGESISGRAIRPRPDTDPLMHLIDWIR